MGKYDELKKRVWDCNMEIPRQGLALFTWGNVSACDRSKEVIAIKPSGVSYDDMRPSDIVILNMDGKVVEGDLNPSSDTKTHLVLYKKFTGIGGIVHTHSTSAVGWAQTCQPIPIYGTTHADHLVHDIPCTGIISDEKIKGDYEEETGNQIIESFQNLSPEEIEMVLVACHGPFTWGKTPEKAVYNAVVLEELAKIAFITKTLRSDTPTLKQSIRNKHFYRKHGATAYYGQK